MLKYGNKGTARLKRKEALAKPRSTPSMSRQGRGSALVHLCALATLRECCTENEARSFVCFHSEKLSSFLCLSVDFTMPKSSLSRVVLFLPDMGRGTGGGTQRVTVNLTRNFVERGLAVDLVLAQKKGPYLSQVAPEVNVIGLETRNIWSSMLPLADYFRRTRPIVVLSALDHANVVALLARRVARVPTRIVVSVRTTLSVRLKENPYRHPWVLPAVRWTYPWADCVIGNSQGVVNDLLKLVSLPPERVRLIYNPLSPELAELAQQPVDHPWFSERQCPLFLAVGRLSHEKDFQTLIRAFRCVREKIPAHLMIVGEGVQRPELEALIHALHLESDVALPGFVSNPFSYMAQADVFVSTSIYEGFPNVLLEAMACGAPVISSDCPSGPSELLMDGKYGSLFPVGDVESLATQMITMLEKPTDPDLLRTRAKDFDINTISNQYIHVLEQAIQ
jgi:glycosyltransferase involved in cell wall biosynthesis